MNDQNNQNQSGGINPPSAFGNDSNPSQIPVVTPENSTPYQPNQVSSSTIDPISPEPQPVQKEQVVPQASNPLQQSPQVENSAPSPFTEAESYQEPPQAQQVNAKPTTSNDQAFEPGNNLITMAQSPKGISKFRIFIIVAILAIAAIYSVVTFLYLQNKKLKETVSEDLPASEVVVENEEVLPTVSAPTVINSETVKILNGNVVLQGSPTSESKIMVDKSNYSSTGITGFARVAVSNDSKYICFESWPPAPEPALYIANTEGSDVKEVSPNRQNCLWSKDSLSVFYTDYSSKSSSKNVYQYIIAGEEEKNITLSSQPTANNRQYDIVGLSADGAKLICKFTEPKDVTGNCEVDLTTLEVTTVVE